MRNPLNPRGDYKVRPLIDRVMEKYFPDPNSGCWLWEGYVAGKEPHVRPNISHHCRNTSVPRFIYKHFNGPIPKGLFVCHRCFVSICINPKHLYLGTPKQNSADMIAAGRTQRGVRNWNAKLDDKKAALIHADQRAPRLIAAEYGVSEAAVRFIKKGTTWVHATGATGPVQVTVVPRVLSPRCIRGHDYDDANTRIAADGSRRCRKCDCIRAAAAYRRRKAIEARAA